jgi:hypothetical protein
VIEAETIGRLPFIYEMVPRAERHLVQFFTVAIGFLNCAYSLYWLFLCSYEHWWRAIGPGNVILLVVHAVAVFVSLFFVTTSLKKLYPHVAFASTVPGVVVCFINRAARFPDFEQLIWTFNAGHLSDPVVQSWLLVYQESFFQYEYIISRSSTGSFTLFVLQIVWMVTVVLFRQADNEIRPLPMTETRHS